jgi:hypothetical protein
MKLRPVYNVPSIANSSGAQSFHLIVSNAKDTPQKQSREHMFYALKNL